MDDDRRKKLVQLIQIGTVVTYVFLVLRSTVGEYFKQAKKNIKNEAKRKEKLKKEKYKQKKKKLRKKRHNNRRY